MRKFTRRLYGKGHKLGPHHKKLLQNFANLISYLFVRFQQIDFKLGNLTNSKALFKIFLRGWRIFPNLSVSKVKRKLKGLLFSS